MKKKLKDELEDKDTSGVYMLHLWEKVSFIPTFFKFLTSTYIWNNYLILKGAFPDGLCPDTML